MTCLPFNAGRRYLESGDEAFLSPSWCALPIIEGEPVIITGFAKVFSSIKTQCRRCVGHGVGAVQHNESAEAGRSGSLTTRAT